MDRGQRTIPVFFYGSFISPAALTRHGFEPSNLRVASLAGFDIRVDPLTRVLPSAGHSVYGVLCQPTPSELRALYSARWMDHYHPQAVLVQTVEGDHQPVLCYFPDGPVSEAEVGPEYLASIVAAAREHNFPGWYVHRLQNCGDVHPDRASA